MLDCSLTHSTKGHNFRHALWQGRCLNHAAKSVRVLGTRTRVAICPELSVQNAPVDPRKGFLVMTKKESRVHAQKLGVATSAIEKKLRRGDAGGDVSALNYKSLRSTNLTGLRG